MLSQDVAVETVDTVADVAAELARVGVVHVQGLHVAAQVPAGLAKLSARLAPITTPLLQGLLNVIVQSRKGSTPACSCSSSSTFNTTAGANNHPLTFNLVVLQLVVLPGRLS